MLRHLWGEVPPLLYRGPPSRQEMNYLDFFLRCSARRLLSPRRLWHRLLLPSPDGCAAPTALPTRGEGDRLRAPQLRVAGGADDHSQACGAARYHPAPSHSPHTAGGAATASDTAEARARDDLASRPLRGQEQAADPHHRPGPDASPRHPRRRRHRELPAVVRQGRGRDVGEGNPGAAHLAGALLRG